jgi:hypothetical protein
MAAALAYVFNERTSCWRTQTPGVAVAGDSTISAWCYSPRRSTVVWGQDGAGATAADIFGSVEDHDLEEPIPGALLVTYPQVPDGDAVGTKRFHEIEYTYSLIGVAANPIVLDYSFGADGGTAVAVTARELPNSPATGTIETPRFFQARAMVPRTNHVGQSLVVRLGNPATTDMGAWRLHAIDVSWQPESARSLQR